jgi:tripartite-type tricarboxylate transporter receptor subunit TctC
MIRLFRRAALAGIGLAIFQVAAAQTYPSKPITLIVPFPPGASADGIARILARKISASLGKPVVVDNRPGAGGTTGLLTATHAAADGYTLAIGATGAIAVNHHLPDAPPLDPEKQLQPIAKVADIPLVLIASQASGIHTLQELGKLAQRDGGISYGTAGQFTSQHLAGELFASTAKVRMTAVPYRGSTPALTDVIAGQVPLGIVDLTSAFPHIKSGRVVPLAVTGASRAKAAPDIPTVSEQGYPGYVASAWLGLFAPVGLPDAVAQKLSGEVRSALADPSVVQEMTLLAAEPSYQDAAEFKRYVSAESKKWAAVVAGMGKAKAKQ